MLFGHCVRLVFLLSPVLPPFLLATVSALSLVCLLVSTLSSSCLPLSHVLSPFLLVTVSGLSPFCLLLFPFLSLYDCNTAVESWETNGNQGRGSTEVKGVQLWAAVSASALQSFACVSQLWTALSASRLQSFTCVSSSGLLCPPCLAMTAVSTSALQSLILNVSPALDCYFLHSFVSQLWTSQTLVAECSG